MVLSLLVRCVCGDGHRRSNSTGITSRCTTGTSTPSWRSGRNPTLVFGLPALIASLIYYLRFRLPFALALIAFFGYVVVSKGLLQTCWHRHLVHCVCGTASSSSPLRSPMTRATPKRVTRFSDCAFWLHLVAAWLIVSPVITLIKQSTNGTETSAIVLLTVLLLALFALAIDRRALLVSSLAYFTIAVYDLLSGGIRLPTSGATPSSFVLTLGMVGGFVLILGVFWHPLGNRLLPLLQIDALRSLSSTSETMTNFSPREIVSELDRYIVGQADAKRAVAIALRNRWRRQQTDRRPSRRSLAEKHPDDRTDRRRQNRDLAASRKARRRAVPQGRSDEIHRSRLRRPRRRQHHPRSRRGRHRRSSRKPSARTCAPRPRRPPKSACIDALVGCGSSPATRDSFRKKLRNNELNDKEIDILVADTASQIPMFDMPGGASMTTINLGEMLGKALGQRTKPRRVTVKDSFDILIAEESDKLIDNDQIVAEAIAAVQNNGIVFLDEIDKICSRGEGVRGGADVSREGVQRDLLPLIEGTTVATKHGPVKTDHILFIASGAFHVSKPSDLLPELQGRLPIRVELSALSREDMKRILTEPEASLIKQYVALLATEGVTLEFHLRRDRRHCRHRRRSEFDGREHRRPAPADGARARPGRDFVRSLRPRRPDRRHRRCLRHRPTSVNSAKNADFSRFIL